MVGSAPAVTAVRRCYDVTTRVRRAGCLEPDVTLAEVAAGARGRGRLGVRVAWDRGRDTDAERRGHFRAPEP
jgi:hypothetical protein